MITFSDFDDICLAAIAEYAFSKGIKTKSGRPKTTDAMKAILKNPIYAGYTKNKLVDNIIKGLHKPLVPIEVIKKNIEIIDGTKKNYVIQGDDLSPLKNILRCSNCKGKLTASRPKGQGGRYPLYHCNAKTCRKSITGKRASISVDIRGARGFPTRPRGSHAIRRGYREALQGLSTT